VVLGTLFLFAVLVVLIHVAAVGHATQPLRLEGLRLMGDAAARDLAEGRQPRLPEPFVFALMDASGRLLDGRLPAGGFRHGELSRPAGEGCAERGRPCWAIRVPEVRGQSVRLVVYPRLLGSSVLGEVSLAFLGSVMAWLAVSALAGLVLLRSLRQADESRRRLLAGLAHDLGTPLTSIRGFAETRLSAGQGGPEERRGWTIVYREALRMQRLVEDMLAITRLEAGRFGVVRRPVDLREVVVAAAERAELAQGSGPAVEVPAEPAVALADRDRIDQVLGNLVDNAYRHGGGRNVRIRLERAGEAAWRISVSDDGPGLPAEARAHLYEAFRPWGARPGSGLGLGIAREIVSRHGGLLKVEDGPGCHVVVDLPASPPERAPR
jgi:signal transduction histidine kinase